MDNYNIVLEILKKTKEEIENMKPVNIMVIGKTGVGKSTLVNNVFREKLAETGIGRPITKHLRKITKEGVPINIYDTKGLELNNEVQTSVKDEIIEKIEQSYKEGEDEHIHIVWYCINTTSSRIEDMEIQMIEEFSKKIPVIVVLTQSIGKKGEDMYKYIDSMNLNIKGIQNVMAEPYEISEDIIIPSSGLKELIEKTYEVIPEAARRAFNNAQQVDIEKKASAARNWAMGYVATTFSVGFTPIPFSDAAVLVPLQVTMLAHITSIFGISIDKAMITSIVASIGGTGGATFLGRYIVSNILKLIPGVGTIMGGVISGSTASILTTALAMSYIEVLTFIARNEREGRKTGFEDIEKMMKEKYEEELKNK